MKPYFRDIQKDFPARKKEEKLQREKISFCRKREKKAACPKSTS